MVFGHFYIKPVAFSTCSVEEKEHVPLSLSLPSPLLSSPLLSSPLPSWIEKANLVTKDKENQKSN
jgi:hypothetical protein